jgi:hypothetical protein
MDIHPSNPNIKNLSMYISGNPTTKSDSRYSKPTVVNCLGIEGELTFIMRTIRRLDLKNVLIITLSENDFRKASMFLRKRKFAFTMAPKTCTYTVPSDASPILSTYNGLPIKRFNNVFLASLDSSAHLDTQILNRLLSTVNINFCITYSYSLPNFIESVPNIYLSHQSENLKLSEKFDTAINLDLSQESQTQESASLSNEDNYMTEVIDRTTTDNSPSSPLSDEPQENTPRSATSVKHIVNNEIRLIFIHALKYANKEIDIISPWISRAVVDDDLISLFESALQRNVRIRIIYGIGDADNPRSMQSDGIADDLKTRFAHFSDLFKIKKGNTHYKLLLCDDGFEVSGSFNFLSNRGDYTDESAWDEGADYSEDSIQVMMKRRTYFDF